MSNTHPVSRNPKGSDMEIILRRTCIAPPVLTDDAGLRAAPQRSEPNPGSIVMTEGDFGTAWQRQFSTGLWHRVSTSGTYPVRGRSWSWLLTQRRLRLVYDAPIRDMAEQTTAGQQ